MEVPVWLKMAPNHRMHNH